MGGEAVAAVLILIGIIGTVIPLLPGVALVGATVGVWAVVNETWWLLALTILLTSIAVFLKFALPARTAQDEASTIALALGAVLAIVGFFVIPVVGLPVGFVAGVMLAEVVRLRKLSSAWRATIATLKSVGVAMLLEFTAAVAMALTWAGAVILR